MKSKEIFNKGTIETRTPHYLLRDIPAEDILECNLPRRLVKTVENSVKAAGFDPGQDVELTRNLLLLNDYGINRLLCSNPLLPPRLQLMVLRRYSRTGGRFHGQKEILARFGDDVQEEIIKAGEVNPSDIATNPRLRRDLQGAVVASCFDLRKTENCRGEVYDCSNINFEALGKLRSRDDYDRRCDQQIAATLMRTQQRLSVDREMGVDHGGCWRHYYPGLELMLDIAPNPCLERDTWEKMIKTAMERTVFVEELLRAYYFEQDKMNLVKMKWLAVDTCIALLSSPALADILKDDPAFQIGEVIKDDERSTAGNRHLYLRKALKHIGREERRAFDNLEPAAREVLPRSWKYVLFG